MIGALIACLPRTLKARRENDATRFLNPQDTGVETEFESEDKRYASPLKAAMSLFNNAPYMFICLAMAFEGGFVTIVATYIVKYAEEMFRISASQVRLSVISQNHLTVS